MSSRRGTRQEPMIRKVIDAEDFMGRNLASGLSSCNAPAPPMPTPDLPVLPSERIGPDENGAIEVLVDTIIVDGQRSQVWLRAIPDGERWHNALVFRRDGKLSPMEAWTTGVDWHLPPEDAFVQARALDEKEKLEYYDRALRPRPPLI